jgi:diguanylate cyclase (GGDEF)-like protein
MTSSTPSIDLPAPRSLPSFLGEGETLRTQTFGVVFSTATYLLYGLITWYQVRVGLMRSDIGWTLTLLALGFNFLAYLVVRNGWVLTGRDPGLARTQLLFGVAMMFAAYAALGPGASGLLVVMASHVVYSMFIMKPRQVWTLVGFTLSGLGVTMLACHWFWPERYDFAVQANGFLYALLVMPLIALLAHRITSMTQRLKAQHLELQDALGRLHELATRDELTRTHNRRHITELLEIEQAQHRRMNLPLCVALIDIDLFKSVNDRHGHAVGDEVLRGFSQFARQQFRESDLLGRWGGEEFLVVLPNTSRASALLAMNRLQQRLAAVSSDIMPMGLRITFSAGVTELSADEDIDHAIERADQAMYRAKTSGRARSLEG